MKLFPRRRPRCVNCKRKVKRPGRGRIPAYCGMCAKLARRIYRRLRSRARTGSPRCRSCGALEVLRKYCRRCSPLAAALWNRRMRRRLKAQGRRYWLDWWRKRYGRAAVGRRRVYQRRYMRAYRRRLRQAA